jgi:hypothetical protein
MGFLSTGLHAHYRSRSGPVATLAVLIGPASQRRNSNGVEATLSYYGGELDVGWRMLSAEHFVLDALVAVSAGRLRSTGVPGERIAIAHGANATWLGAGPGVQLSEESGWGGWSLQTAVPVGLVRPEYVLSKNGSESGKFFKVPAVGVELSLRLFIRGFGW